MKNLALLFSCMLCLILFESCIKNNKENPINPLQPQPYLPVYPGSYWKYVGGNFTTIMKVSDNYVEFQGMYLTILDEGYGHKSYIKGYDKWRDAGSNHTSWIRIFSEAIGSSWQYNIGSYPFYYYDDFEYYEVLQKTVDGSGDTIIIQRHCSMLHDNNNRFYTWQKFKKNVGLICEFQINTITNDTTYSLVLTEYHINH